jgi:hypothetical protein
VPAKQNVPDPFQFVISALLHALANLITAVSPLGAEAAVLSVAPRKPVARLKAGAAGSNQLQHPAEEATAKAIVMR